MMTSSHPSRLYLMKLKEDIRTAETGKDILKEKTDALIISFFKKVKERKVKRTELDREMEEGLRKILHLEMLIGSNALEAESFNDDKVYIEKSIEKIMGLVLESFSAKTQSAGFFFEGPLHLDEAKEKFRAILEKTLYVGNLENNITRIFREMRRIRRITGSLDNNIIPGLKSEKKWIEERLSQFSREDVMRYKMMKKKLNRG